MFSENAIATLNSSNFLCRFLDFAERYSQFKNNHSLFETAMLWANDKNYEYIRYYLSLSSNEAQIPFSLDEFVCMNHLQMFAWHEYCMELKYFLDEKKALYNELNQFYS